MLCLRYLTLKVLFCVYDLELHMPISLPHEKENYCFVKLCYSNILLFTCSVPFERDSDGVYFCSRRP